MSEEVKDPTEFTDEELSQAIATPPEEELPAPTEPPIEEPKEEPVPEVTEPPAEETVTLTKAEHEKMKRQIEEKEKFIQRQSKEVGQRRKSEEQLRAEIFSLEQRLADAQYDPVATRQIHKELDSRERQLDEISVNSQIEANKAAVTTFVAEPETYLDDIVELLREDGQPDEEIREFRNNPFSVHPGIVINLAKRAEAVRNMRNKDAEIASLKAEVAALKAEPKKVVKKIEETLKQPQTMTNASGQGTSVKSEIDVSQIPYLSDAELKKAIEESS